MVLRYLFTSIRHGVSAKELQHQLGVTYKCAWRMGHEMRWHMFEVDGDKIFSGHIDIDETYLGGKPTEEFGRPNPKKTKKTTVLGMVERDGDIITETIYDTKNATLHPMIMVNVEHGSTISTDEFNGYKKLPEFGYTHGSVNHSCDGIHHPNTLEGYWAYLKKSINSTHIHISKRHTRKYLKEFEYRYNSRENPALMFPELISTYRAPF